MSKRPTKAELEAERAKYDGLTEPQAGLLFIAQRSHGSQFASNLARYKKLQAVLPLLISEGYWDEDARECTPKGLAVVRTVAGAHLAPVHEAQKRLEARQAPVRSAAETAILAWYGAGPAERDEADEGLRKVARGLLRPG